MRNALLVQTGAVVLALLLVVALARIYAAAILPLWRNQRLARHGLRFEPDFRPERTGILGWTFRLVPVIVIIAIVAAVAIPALQNGRFHAQAAARDRQRVADLRLIQTALEEYAIDHGGYPAVDVQNFDRAGFAGSLKGLVAGGYLTSLPNDPLGEADTYIYSSDWVGNYYCLGTDMEGPAPPSTCDTTKLGHSISNSSAAALDYAIGP